jgi:hypothetical protein
MRHRLEVQEMEDKTQLLLDGAKGLRSLADALEIAADVLKDRNIKELLTKKDTEQVKTPADDGPLTLTDVRKVLAEKSREGFTDQVRALLEKYGADKLSAIDPSKYKDLISEAECLGATKDDLSSAIDEKSKDGFGENIHYIFGHHHATSLEDLKPEYYAGFLRDIRGIGHE